MKDTHQYWCCATQIKFLEGMLPICQDIVRIGGSAKSEFLNLHNIISLKRTYYLPGNIKRNMHECKYEKEKCFEGIQIIKKNNSEN